MLPAITSPAETIGKSEAVEPRSRNGISSSWPPPSRFARRGVSTTGVADQYEQVYAAYASASSPELMMELSDLLGRLDPKERTLLLYKFYYGLKDAEIASALQMPVGTVKAQIHRSKARLNALDKEDNKSHT